jgi:hypothetical protein
MFCFGQNNAVILLILIHQNSLSAHLLRQVVLAPKGDQILRFLLLPHIRSFLVLIQLEFPNFLFFFNTVFITVEHIIHIPQFILHIIPYVTSADAIML